MTHYMMNGTAKDMTREEYLSKLFSTYSLVSMRQQLSSRRLTTERLTSITA